MKKAFKVASVISSTLLLGISTVMAGGFSPFVVDNSPDFSAVYGDTSSDAAAAASIGNHMLSLVEVPTTPGNESVDDGSSQDSEPNIDSGIKKVNILMGSENDKLSMNDTIDKSFDDRDVDYLIDGKISWDDGDDDDNYDVHEEIKLLDDKIGFMTPLSDEDLEEDYALTNDKGISYKYVFDDEIDHTKIGNGDADNLKIDFLGKTLEIRDADDKSIRVVSSEEIVVGVGDTKTVGDTTITVNEIFENHVQIDGVLVEKGQSEKISGLVVEVETVAYQSSDKESKALIRVGEDISKEYSDGEAYIGEDKRNPKWVWDIGLGVDEDEQYIGITYDEKESDSDDDILYPGQAYILPEGYAALKFKSTTDVDYKDYSLSIDEVELHDESEEELYKGDDKSVIVIEGDDDESIEVNGDIDEETSKIFLYYNKKSKSIDTFYYDEDEYKAIMYDSVVNDSVGILKNDDTEIDIKVELDDTELDDTDLFVEFGDDIVTRFKIDDDIIKSLGDHSESAENDEVTLNSKNVGNKDYDVINYKGYKIFNPESNGENDEVVFSIPSDVVEATVAVGKPEVIGNDTDDTDDTNDTDDDQTTTPTPTTPDYAYITQKVSQINNVKDRNLVVVGGSCINGVAAQLLDGQKCGDEFTAATGVGEGEAIIKSYQSPYAADKVAVLVAGYDKADTTRAVNELKKGTYDLAIGQEHIV